MISNMKYVKIPKAITFEEIRKKKYHLSPSKYAYFSPPPATKNVSFLRVSDLVTLRNERTRINYRDNYYYIEIGDIDVETGGINYKEFRGISLPNKNPKKVRKGDILISTVRTYRKGIGFVNLNKNNIRGTSAFIIIKDLKDEFKNRLTKEYLYSFLRSDFTTEQILSLQNREMYPRLDRDSMDSIWIPVHKNREVINFVSVLMKAIIRKEAEIKKKYNRIIELIDKELKENQKPNGFIYSMPSFTELQKTERLDASIYSLDFKKKIFYVENYKKDATKLKNLGFKPRRGPNLAVSVIGRSIYREEAKSNFYTLIEPMDITDFMTIRRLRWLGNKTRIPHLRKGDILFGAEGSIGKVYIFCEDMGKTITNYHGMAINADEIHLVENVFLGCFLSFLKEQGIFDKISVGGQGGSVGKDELESLHIPNFPSAKKEEIAKYYYSPTDHNENRLNVTDFENEDIRVTTESGIWQLDNQIRQTRQELDAILYRIIMDEKVKISF